MRCRACGGKLVLTRVVAEVVPGFEHHTFVCSECHVTEHRIVLIRHGREDESVPLRISAEPPKLR